MVIKPQQQKANQIKTQIRIITNGLSRFQQLEVKDLADLERQCLNMNAPDAFVATVYTNNGAHAPIETWYPVMAIRELKNCKMNFINKILPVA